MKVRIGTKVSTVMPNGLIWPAVAITEETSKIVSVISKQTNLPVDITVTEADFISLRERLDGEQYLAMTTETVQYGYRPTAMPRFTSVEGLDVTEDGAVVTLAELMTAHAASYAKFAADQFEARRGALSAADL